MAIYFNNHKDFLVMEAMRLNKTATTSQKHKEVVTSVAYWKSIFAYYYPKLRVHLLALAWVVVGTVASGLGEGWSLLDGIHFCVSCMSTSGIRNIPDGSSDLAFFLVGVYTCIGVPLMALSSSLLVHYIVMFGKRQEFDQVLTAGVTEREVESMAMYGLVDGDGHIDISEYVILILLRLGLLKPDLIRLIDIRYLEMKTAIAAAAAAQVASESLDGKDDRAGGGRKDGRRVSIQNINRLSQTLSIQDISAQSQSPAFEPP
jgi:hypothetical protein